MRHHIRNRDTQPRHRGDQRLRDSTRQTADDTRPLYLDHLEGLDHAPHGAQQAEQRRDAGYSADHLCTTLKLGGFAAADFLKPFFDHGPSVSAKADGGLGYAGHAGVVVLATGRDGIVEPRLLEKFLYLDHKRPRHHRGASNHSHPPKKCGGANHAAQPDWDHHGPPRSEELDKLRQTLLRCASQWFTGGEPLDHPSLRKGRASGPDPAEALRWRRPLDSCRLSESPGVCIIPGSSPAPRSVQIFEHCTVSGVLLSEHGRL